MNFDHYDARGKNMQEQGQNLFCGRVVAAFGANSARNKDFQGLVGATRRVAPTVHQWRLSLFE
jgi:hypothetical protein